MSKQRSHTWEHYYKKTENRTPNETVCQAIGYFAAESRCERFAIDLGCGVGHDTIALLNNGWHVLAIDQQQQALDRVTAKISLEQQSRLATRLAVFETVQLPPADLINASYSLPFCLPQHFDHFWSRLVESIRLGGRFSGHLFGNRDDWAKLPKMTCHTLDQFHALLTKFEIEFFFERDEVGQTAAERCKHWHVFSVVARKIKV